VGKDNVARGVKRGGGNPLDGGPKKKEQGSTRTKESRHPRRSRGKKNEELH